MSEETGTTDSTQDGTTTTPALNSFIGDEGELKEGWKESYVPEELRSSPIYDRIKDIKGAFSIIANQEKLVGKKGTILPTDLSKPEEWDAFYETLGRPKTVEDYNLPIPEEYKDYYDEDMIKEARGVFHKIGLNQKQADALWEFEKARVALMDKTLEQEEQRVKLEAETALKQKWGTAYPENMHIADRVISENIPPEKVQDFLDKYGNNPDIAEVLATIGKKFVEHRIISDISLPSASADKRIDELMGKNLPTAQQMTLPYWDSNHVDHKATVEMVQNLMREQAARKTGTT